MPIRRFQPKSALPWQCPVFGRADHQRDALDGRFYFSTYQIVVLCKFKDFQFRRIPDIYWKMIIGFDQSEDPFDQSEI